MAGPFGVKTRKVSEGFRGEPDAVTEVPNLVTSVQNLGRVKVSNMWHVLPHF